MLIIALLLLALTSIVIRYTVFHTTDENWTAWQEFLAMEQVQTRISSSEYDFDHRYEIFKENLETINAHNMQNFSWTMKMNHLSDMTHEEFLGLLTLEVGNESDTSNVSLEESESIDGHTWCTEAEPCEVLYQGRCGSCWAFSTIESIFYLNEIETGQRIMPSAQYLVDCVPHGCHGGKYTRAWEYIIENGICTEADYPYTAKDGQCRACTKYHPITGYKRVPQSTASLTNAVNRQPISISVDAHTWHHYHRGIHTGDCGVHFDHAVLVVGWADDYWIVQNSWGHHWGENGFIRLCRNCNSINGWGQCGLLRHAYYPINQS